MSSGIALPKLLLNVPALAHRSPEMVERVLGKPEQTSGAFMSPNQKVSYRGGKVEVVYIEGKASWIKLYDTRKLSFSPESLSRLGLPPKKPTYNNRNHVMSWSRICNLREVSFYSDSNGGVSSVLVCADEPASSPPSMKHRTLPTRGGGSFWTKPITLSAG